MSGIYKAGWKQRLAETIENRRSQIHPQKVCFFGKTPYLCLGFLRLKQSLILMYCK